MNKPVFLLSLLFFLSAGGSTSLALEEYAEDTGQDCEYCHVDPSGGAELTDIGRGYLLSIEEAGSTEVEKKGAGSKSGGLRVFRFMVGFVHMFTAIFWFGTILYVHLVLKPAYASRGLPRGEVRVGLISMVVMAVTGTILTYYRVPSWEFLVTTRFGILLVIKIGLFLFLLLSALIVVLFIGPRLRTRKQAAAPDIGDMTLTQLAYFDGKDGRKALIGYKDRIYDVTQSKMWKSGIHMMKHHAGEDLSAALEQAPHGPEPIEERMPSPGKILPDSGQTDRFSYTSVFYFMAYVNLIVVVGVIAIVSMWRWW